MGISFVCKLRLTIVSLIFIIHGLPTENKIGKDVLGRRNKLNKNEDNTCKIAIFDRNSDKTTKVLDQAEFENIVSLADLPDLADTATVGDWSKHPLQIQKNLIKQFPDNLHLLNLYGVEFFAVRRNEEALKVFEYVLKRDGENALASVYYGYLLMKVHDKYEESIFYLKQGITSNEEGTQDKRFYVTLGDALQRFNKVDEAYAVYEQAVLKEMFPSKWQRPVEVYAGLSAHSWWTVEQTSYSKQLQAIESKWMTIKKEGITLLDEKKIIFKADKNLLNVGNWRQFVLYAGGKKIEENCSNAPKTCQIVETFLEAVTCKQCQIKFSVIESGTHVWPHCGPTNCRLRGHLGLVVPPSARIRVGNETRTWKIGQFIVFDDSFEHEIWFDGPGYRLVLIVDFWHPDLVNSLSKNFFEL